jgi:DNA-binding NarL/FixJ family response regulator
VLALTVHEDRGYIRQLLAAGATGYALKRAAPEELVHAIRVVAAGGMYLDPAVAAKVAGGFVKQAGTEAAAEGELSEREEEVARLTAAGHGNKEIASRLDLSVKTVETYRARALEKLGLKGRAELVRYAAQQGWLQEG